MRPDRLGVAAEPDRRGVKGGTLAAHHHPRLTTLATALGLEVTDPALKLDGVAIDIASVAVGGALEGIGFATGLAEASTTLISAVTFGLGAGWLGSGGVDALRSLFPRARSAGA